MERLFRQKSGFLSPVEVESNLPSDLKNLDSIISQLQHLLRTGTLHTAIENLPCLVQVIDELPRRFLPRVSIILSTLAHGFKWEERCLSTDNSFTSEGLPQNLFSAWEAVSKRLGREAPKRMIEDDFLDNYRSKDGGGFELAIPYFNLPEERMNPEVQIRMERKFTPALSAMLDATKHMEHLSPEEALANSFESISRAIVDCGKIFTGVPIATCDGPNYYDPVIWGRTYPEIGQPIVPGEISNSGINSPLFHAMDCFLGVNARRKDSELLMQKIKRRSLLPMRIRQMLEFLEEAHESIDEYLKANPDGPASNSFKILQQTYSWFLKRHRFRAMGFLPLVLGVGRQHTTGGLPRVSTQPSEDILEGLIKRSSAARFVSGPPPLDVKIESCSPAGSKTTSLAIVVPCCPPIQPGDTIQVWPEEFKSDYGTPSHPDNLRTSPRYYTIALVETLDNQTTRLSLTIANGSGHSGDLFCSLPPGSSIKAVLTPRPHFRLPSDNAQPMLLIAQGSGVGPFLGFLKERSRIADAKEKSGKVILVAAAKNTSNLPYFEDFVSLTKCLPLEVHLATSDGPSCVVRNGKQETFEKAKGILDTLLDVSETVKANMADGQGHTFVSGGGSFGEAVRDRMESLGLFTQPHGRYHDSCRGGKPRTDIPAREITVTELAKHNTPTDLWVSLEGIVYDLTNWSSYHPGGWKTLMDIAGTVADRRFFQVHTADTNQGQLSRIRPYAIGTLQECDAKSLRMRLLSMIARKQNELTNNTMFSPDRTVAFYAYCDSIRVCWGALDDIARFSRKEGLDNELFDKLNHLSGSLNQTCWDYIATGPGTLEEREAIVHQRYTVQWERCHDIYNGMKDICIAEDDSISENELADSVYKYLTESLHKLVASA